MAPPPQRRRCGCVAAPLRHGVTTPWHHAMTPWYHGATAMAGRLPALQAAPAACRRVRQFAAAQDVLKSTLLSK